VITRWGVSRSRTVQVAALDARIVIVITDDDEQQCAVPDDGFIAVLIYAKWGETPRITVQTYSGSKEPG